MKTLSSLTASFTASLGAFQRFVSQVRALASPYFNSEDKWKARGLLAAIVALNLATVYVAVLFNDW